MIRRVSHLTLALIVIAALSAPAALAGSGKPKKHHKHSGSCVSAVCVYYESGPSLTGNGPPVALSPEALKKLQQLGGKDARALQALGTARAFGMTRPRRDQAPSVANVSPPSTFLAALDLGPGPIALFAVLLAGAMAFGLGGALRRRRAGH